MPIDPRDHLGLAFNEAKRFAQRIGERTEDWTGEAYIILERAARGFKPELGFTFATYATRSLRLELHRSRMRAQGFKASSTGKVWRGVTPGAFDEAYMGGRRVEEVEELSLDACTGRQYEVARMLAGGCSAIQAGRALGIGRERVRQIKIQAGKRIVEAA